MNLCLVFAWTPCPVFTRIPLPCFRMFTASLLCVKQYFGNLYYWFHDLFKYETVNFATAIELFSTIHSQKYPDEGQSAELLITNKKTCAKISHTVLRLTKFSNNLLTANVTAISSYMHRQLRLICQQTLLESQLSCTAWIVLAEA